MPGYKRKRSTSRPRALSRGHYKKRRFVRKGAYKRRYTTFAPRVQQYGQPKRVQWKDIERPGVRRRIEPKSDSWWDRAVSTRDNLVNRYAKPAEWLVKNVGPSVVSFGLPEISALNWATKGIRWFGKNARGLLGGLGREMEAMAQQGVKGWKPPFKSGGFRNPTPKWNKPTPEVDYAGYRAGRYGGGAQYGNEQRQIEKWFGREYGTDMNLRKGVRKALDFNYEVPATQRLARRNAGRMLRGGRAGERPNRFGGQRADARADQAAVTAGKQPVHK